MTKKEFVKIFKRFFLTFLVCIPIFIVIGIFLTPIIGNVLSVVIYALIGAGAFVLEEIWWDKHSKKMEEKRQENLKLRREKKLLKARYGNLQEKKDENNGK